MQLKERLKSIKYLRLIIGILLGAAAGYAYFFHIGCNSGTCPITSDPLNSTLYGALIGAVFMYKEKKNSV